MECGKNGNPPHRQIPYWSFRRKPESSVFFNFRILRDSRHWIPAFAGMTREGEAEIPRRPAKKGRHLCRPFSLPIPFRRKPESPSSKFQRCRQFHLRLVAACRKSPVVITHFAVYAEGVCCRKLAFFINGMQSAKAGDIFQMPPVVIRRQCKVVIRRFALHFFGESGGENIALPFSAR